MDITKDGVPFDGFSAGEFSGEFSFSVGEGGIEGGSAILRSPPSKKPTMLASALFRQQ